jgi:hypothetical protein
MQVESVGRKAVGIDVAEAEPNHLLSQSERMIFMIFPWPQSTHLKFQS